MSYWGRSFMRFLIVTLNLEDTLVPSLSREFVVTEAFMVGGQRVQTAKIMLCTAGWLTRYWEQPMMALKELLPKKKKSCSIQ